MVAPLEWMLPLAALLVTGLAELLHARRCRRLARLAFGPAGRARLWTRGVPALRTAAMAGAAWSLWVLWTMPTAAPARSRAPQTAAQQHLILALDVSPSMQIEDAGPGGRRARGDQARALLKELVARVDMTRTRVSLIAFYTEARPVVVDTFDPAVLENVLDDLPLGHAFAHGKTDMYAAVEAAAAVARTWRPSSASLVVVADGDSLPEKRFPPLPPALASAVVVGVGDVHRGTWIDGHASRQEAVALERLALRLGGSYWDGTRGILPDRVLRRLTALRPPDAGGRLGRRGLALLVLGISAGMLALLGPALALAGSPWRRVGALRAADGVGLAGAETPARRGLGRREPIETEKHARLAANATTASTR